MIVDERFPTMGVHARILAEYPEGADPDAARAEVAGARARVEAIDARLTRFSPTSELSRLNADPAPSRTVSALLGRAVGAAVAAARRTDGLVDPTLVDEIEDIGYRGSRRGVEPVDLRSALDDAPPRREAGARPQRTWATVVVAPDLRTIHRPPGVRLDLGGIGKGLAADQAGALLGGADRYAVDVGGDLVLGGPGALARPWSVDVRDPWSGGVAHTLRLGPGGVATSGLDVRLWRDDEGHPRHHLLDAATGAPAWTGVVAATALAPSALQAEVAAKAAFLAGPVVASERLRRRGGALALEDGTVRLVGLRPAPTVVRLPRPTRRAAA
jgi:thiamine biosynthesis lipoprotein